ncbi:hypothetical protein II906_00170, partial [bacterium]|nr:hypothetical protein [bacterium]
SARISANCLSGDFTKVSVSSALKDTGRDVFLYAALGRFTLIGKKLITNTFLLLHKLQNTKIFLLLISQNHLQYLIIQLSCLKNNFPVKLSRKGEAVWLMK